MSELSYSEQQRFKTLFRASLAAAAPSVAFFVASYTTSVVSLISIFGLGRLGVVALGVVTITLAFLLWRGRWWAGVPSLIAAAGGAVWFGIKFARPMYKYLSANPINSLGDLGAPIMMLSPALVVMVIAVGLFLAILKGVRLAREMGPRPVSRRAWIVVIVWLLMLGGAYAYQSFGWRWFNDPGALVVRLCSPDQAVAKLARTRLHNQGAKAVPDLVLALETKDPDLECMRSGALQVLADMGPEAGAALVDMVREGKIGALWALGRVGTARDAKRLLEVYRDPGRKPDLAFDRLLEKTIEKLNPSLKLDR